MVTQTIKDQIAEWLWTLALGERDLEVLLLRMLAEPLEKEPRMLGHAHHSVARCPGQPEFLGDLGDRGTIYQVRTVRRWLMLLLRASEHDYPLREAALSRKPTSLQEAVVCAEADLTFWQISYESRGGTGRFEAALLQERKEMIAVLAIGERLRWFELLTPAALVDEGECMGNCLGSSLYVYRLIMGQLRVFSLRGRSGFAHVSLTVDDGMECEHRGRTNKPTVEKYRPAVEALAKMLGVDAYARPHKNWHTDVPSTIGQLPGSSFGRNMDWSGRKDVDHLPAGLKVKGSLIVSGCPRLAALPHDLTVDEDVVAENCPSLTIVQDGLKVRRNLLLEQCENLVRLPEGLDVPGILDVSGCTRLTELPNGLSVGARLVARACTSLTTLPEKLHVWGDADFTGSAIRCLPRKTYIEGDLRILGCANLEVVGPDVVLEGLILSDHGVFYGVELLRWYLDERRKLTPGQALRMLQSLGRVEDRKTHEVIRHVALDRSGRLRDETRGGFVFAKKRMNAL